MSRADSIKNITEKFEQIVEEKNTRIEQLEAQLRYYKRQIFQSKSERYENDFFQQELFNELEWLFDEKPPEDDQQSNTTDVKPHKRKTRKARALSPELPRVEVIHDIPETQKQCACGQAKDRIGEEVLEQLGVIPAKYYVIRHVRPKYACSCKQCSTPPVLAPAPKMALPKSQASSQLLAFLMTHYQKIL